MKTATPGSVFITGANGFIGANLVRLLINKGYQVNVLVRKSSNLWRLTGVLKQIKTYGGDVTDKNSLQKIVKRVNPEFIFHLASYGNSSVDKDLNEMIKVNVIGLKNLLETTLSVNYKAMVIVGSSSEYGFKNKPMKETDILEPNSYYSATKAAATMLAQSFALLNNKPISIARPFSVYGPYEEQNRLIPTVIRLALTDKEISLTSGKVFRDFIFVEDFNEGLLKMAQAKLKSGEIINLGTGVQSDNKDVVKIIEKILNKKLDVKIGKFPKRAWDTNYWVADNHKAKKVLNWTPKYNLEQGLKKTISYV